MFEPPEGSVVFFSGPPSSPTIVLFLGLLEGGWLLPLPDGQQHWGWSHMGLTLFLSDPLQVVSQCSEDLVLMPSVSESESILLPSKFTHKEFS